MTGMEVLYLFCDEAVISFRHEMKIEYFSGSKDPMTLFGRLSCGTYHANR